MNNINYCKIIPGPAFFLLLAISIVWYWPGLMGGWMLDDRENLAPLSDITDDPASWYAVISTNISGTFGRPVAMLSFALDHYTHGGDVWFFKYTNLMLHVLCGALIFWLTGRLLNEHSRFSSQRWLIALWVTSMWMLTPIQVSTTLYIVQRMTQLSALFVLIGLLFYVIGRQSIVKHPKLSLGLIASSFTLWTALAVLSKENGILLPLLLFVVELFHFRFDAEKSVKRTLYALYSVFLLVPILIAGLMLISNPDLILKGYNYRDFTLIERLLTETRVLFEYVRNLLLPNSVGLGLYHDDFIKSKGIFQPITTFLSIIGWLAVLSASWVYRSSRIAPLFFGLLFFLAAHALESTIFSLELYFEHRNYLPSFGIFLTVAMGFHSLANAAGNIRVRALILLLAGLLPVIHAIATYQRVQTWTSYESILLTAEHSHPNSLRVHGDLGVYYYNVRELEKSLYHLDKVKAINPISAPAVAVHKLIAYCFAKEPFSEEVYKEIISNLSPQGAKYLKSSLKTLLEVRKKKQCATVDIRKITDIIGNWLREENIHGRVYKDWLLVIILAQLLETQKIHNKAIYYLDWATDIFPDRLESGLLKIRNQLSLGDIEGALKTIQETKARDNGRRPDHSKALNDYEVHLRSVLKANGRKN